MIRSMVRGAVISGAALLAVLPGRAAAETVVVYTNPMTLERTVVITDTRGRDRAFHCYLPPSNLGCQPIAVRRGR